MKKIKLQNVLIGLFAIGAIGSVFSGPSSDTPADTEAPPAIVQQEEITQNKESEEIAQNEESEEIEETPTQEIEDSPTEPPEEEPTNAEASAPITAKEPEQVAASTQVKPTEAPEQAENPIETAVEVAPEQAFRESLYQYTYVGSNESDKYHYPRCRAADKINEGNLVHFETIEEAAAAGYSPCGICKPPK